jgi:iron complex outermembrane receptor protein
VWGVYAFQDGFLKGLGLGLGVVTVGRRPADNFDTVNLPSDVRADAAIYYRPWKHLDLALNFKNLFDVQYFETSTVCLVMISRQGPPNIVASPKAPLSVRCYGH